MNKWTGLVLAALLFAPSVWAAGKGGQAKIQVALLLDTSNSMDGLIDQARAELWSVVNAFATARRGGDAPALEIALFEYGNDGLNPTSGYIRQVAPFTRDLDSLSARLFELRTNGGSEYCGWVIDDAIRRLEWSNAASDLRVIFIAGNEPFTQGPLPFPLAIQRAVDKDVIVNTVHCGAESEGRRSGWSEGARLGRGHYLFINQGLVAENLRAPQDGELGALSRELNSTYVPFGADGAQKALQQAQQDVNASNLGWGTASTRATSKASRFYVNSNWDLVDAVNEGKVSVRQVAPERLPANMRGMSPDAREAYIGRMNQKRASLRAEIQKLSAARASFIQKERAKQNAHRDATLGSALLAAAREEAESRGFTLEN